MELWRNLHLDPTAEGGGGEDLSIRDDNASAQVDPDDRPDFNGGSGDVSEGSGDTTPVRQAPADPNNRVNHAAPVQQGNTEWTSIREAARQAGFDFGHGVDNDEAALNMLLQRAQASRQQSMYEQLGRQLAPQAERIQQFVRSQQQPAAAPARKPWEAPEFDERWGALVERDPATGLFFAKPGTPPEIAAKVNEFVEWKSKLDQNPAAVLNEMVKAQAQEIAQVTDIPSTA